MRLIIIGVLLVCLAPLTALAQDAVTITPIAHGLNNPRGVAVNPDGSLLVVEAGLGTDTPNQYRGKGSGTITHLQDVNQDGDFDDEGERTFLIEQAPSYNSLNMIRTGHDEVYGLGDIVRTASGDVFFTVDDPFYAQAGNRGEEMHYGNTGIFMLTVLVWLMAHRRRE